MHQPWYDPFEVKVPTLGDLDEKDHDSKGSEVDWATQSNKVAYEL